MKTITCEDIYGNLYEIEEREFIDRHAVYGIYIKDNEILLTRDAWAKRLGLPGGGIDEGETHFQALAREFMEETGLEISEKTKLIVNDSSYFKPEGVENPWRTHRSFYAVNIIGGKLKKEGNNEDVVEAAFYPLTKIINEIEKTKRDQPVIKYLKDFL